MLHLKRIGALFLAKLLALAAAFAGLGAGIVYSFGGLAYDLSTDSLGWGTLLAFGALLGMPLLFAMFGFIAGAIAATLYNFSTRWFEGVSVDIDTQ